MPAIIARRSMRAPTAVIVQDLWPDSVLESGMLRSSLGRVAKPLLTAVSNAAYTKASSVGIISRGMRKVLIERGVDNDRIFFTPNSVDLPAEPSAPLWDRRQVGIYRGVVFTYAGTVGPLQNLKPLVAAFRDLHDCHLIVVGGGNEWEAIKGEAAGMPNVHVLPRVSAELAHAISLHSDVNIVSMKDGPLMRVTMPSKVQSCLAAGRPILVHGAGDAADAVVRARAGLACMPSDQVGIRTRILELGSMPQCERERMGERARAEFVKHYTEEVVGDKLEQLLAAALAGAR